MLGAVSNHCVLTKDVINDLSDWMIYGKPQHLYVTYNDEIKEGDFVIVTLDNFHLAKILKIDVVNNMFVVELFDFNGAKIRVFKSEIKKIIATTDNIQVADYDNYHLDYNPSKHLPEPSQSFIEKYIKEYNKGNVITDVLVEYERTYLGKSKIGVAPSGQPTYINEGYSDWFLKVNPKDNTINIKPTKTGWNRNEVIELIHQYSTDIHLYDPEYCDKWIEKNL